MSNSDTTPDREASLSVFLDPVAFLASFGIDSELVTDTSLPVAA
jgi:hypothetical protein